PPVRMLMVRRVYHHLMLRGHALPLVHITVLKAKPFRVGAVAEDDRILAVHDRVVDIGAKYEAVVHRDRHAPVDSHAVSYFRAMLHRVLSVTILIKQTVEKSPFTLRRAAMWMSSR